MNELRWDPTKEEWIAYATYRQDRTFLPPKEYCPLYPTKQDGDFPTEVPRPSYEIVVFENKFPSLVLGAPEPEDRGGEITPTAPGRGVCEVVHARFPYEAHVYARRCAHSIASLDDEERRDLARILKRLLAGYDALFGFSLPYMMFMHQTPTDGEDYEGIAHFHIEFYPPNRTAEKLKYLAGSETGAGVFVMDAAPEDTARELRKKIEDSTR